MELPFFHCVPNAFELTKVASPCSTGDHCDEIDTDCSNLFIKDCKKAFTCRSLSKKGDKQYSSGSTFFIRANSEPRCLLESIALSIFKYHTGDNSSNTQGVPEFDPSISGAEWWTQVIDHRDEIGMHWDRDYGLESDVGVHQYPYKGSVSYFSDVGSPTIVIVNGKGSDMASDDITDTKLDPPYVLSYPRCGKHISFDGTCLHGAPVDLILQESNEDELEDEVYTSLATSNKRKILSDVDTSNTSGDSKSARKKVKKVLNRVTFLVNIWINHVPVSSVPYPDNKIKHLQPVSNEKDIIINNLNNLMSETIEPNSKPKTINYPNIETIRLHSKKSKDKDNNTILNLNSVLEVDEYRMSNWSFVSNQNDLLLKIPLPPVDKLTPYCDNNHEIHNLCVDYQNDSVLCAKSVVECDSGSMYDDKD